MKRDDTAPLSTSPRITSVRRTTQGNPGRRRGKTVLVRDNMTRDVIATTPDQSLRMAGERMRKHNVRRLPVVRDGKLKGGQ